MERDLQPELMDAPDVDPAEHVHALRTLNRANRLLGVDRQLAAALRGIGATIDAGVLDLGSGGSGFLARLAGQRRSNPAGERPLMALDLSAFALSTAHRWHGGRIQGLRGDARHIPLADDSVDVVSSSLFLHHLTVPDAIVVLKEAARVSRLGIVMGDLVRSRSAWALTWLFTRVTSRSRLYHLDGPQSVRAAYRPPELAGIAKRADLNAARIQRCFPFRMLLTWKKDA